ncbi:uncharacterized protein LOC122642091 [Telopea speciosissima]|uniref:uncharacterized protein LOC122642091 n=1 Tax=Telopea speciosissima TaxID=54955 RepID=UPI001CC4E36B|nr:uncharacterized protein LOC122642091 [Telopea speciosissima]
MGSKGLVLAKCSWVSTLLAFVLLFLLVLPSMVKAQFLDCSNQGMVGLDHLEPCLNYQVKSSMDACCQVLNQMVKSGYHCLCLLLSSTTTSSLSAAPLSLPFANCYISVPPLRQCPGNSNVPAPLVLPPIIDGREPTNPPSSMATIFAPLPPSPLISLPLPLPPPPPLGIQTSMNLTQGRSFTIVEEPHSNKNSQLNLTMPDNIGRIVRSYSCSGECRKEAKIWTNLWVVFVVVILLRTSIL